MSTAPRDDILRHLTTLVGIDSQNPPRAVQADSPLVQACSAALPGFQIDVTDHGDGSVIIDARRGAAPVLFNVHLDTVPVADGWTRDPFTLAVTDGRAIGLGACDIKGAAACLFALAATTDAPMHIVLSTDEEAGQSTCIRRYTEAPPDVDLAIIAEPTMGHAITSHRGIFSARMTFSGESGHSSAKTKKSAIHGAARWMTRSLDASVAEDVRLNIGRIEGGVKPNMIAAHAEVLFGFRHAPGMDYHTIFGEHFALETPGVETHIRFAGPAMPSDANGKSAQAQQRAVAWCKQRNIAMGPAVDFFTEAAFFSAAGIPAIVLGPGNIEQAHTADEWVALTQLDQVFQTYAEIVSHVGV